MASAVADTSTIHNKFNKLCFIHAVSPSRIMTTGECCDVAKRKAPLLLKSFGLLKKDVDDRDNVDTYRLIIYAGNLWYGCYHASNKDDFDDSL